MFDVVDSQMFNFSTRLFFNKHAISKKDGYVSLYIEVYIAVDRRYEQGRFPLSLRWPADRVDRDAGLLLPRHRSDPDANDYNMIIMDRRGQYNEVAKMFRLANRVLDLKSFRRELKYNDSRVSLAKFMQERNNERYAQGEIQKQTWKNTKCTIKALIEFQELIRFDEIDEAWMKRFRQHLKKTGLRMSSIWTRIKDLKAYLRLADQEATISVNPKAINFSNQKVDSLTVYCNRDEIKRLMILLRAGNLTGTQTQVLRAFLFTCFTSLRVSDLYRANAEWLVTDNMLVFTQHKNRERKPKAVKIPLNSIAKSLIKEARQTFFELPTEQEYNRTLKELAAKAEIRKNLTSHVGRHTFGFLYMTTVGNIEGLKRIMGHSKLTTTERYAHLDDDYNLTQVMKLEEGFEDVSGRGRVRKIG
ncbi:MAG TPA: phage integrase SAM-like domain-containing protein [Parapedobacter sp.]|uniref:site-specific integrase n=1 Tax=Parapedobacter sp. TaxID=1958893 RepID=UPI002CB5780F|nr:phage integrase SAM-like domain-containing protein [Parapedobacter sp.]HWK58095.1 phage integrase SAM-like domain-containing protein [Parapedobacter sp.]